MVEVLLEGLGTEVIQVKELFGKWIRNRPLWKSWIYTTTFLCSVQLAHHKASAKILADLINGFKQGSRVTEGIFKACVCCHDQYLLILEVRCELSEIFKVSDIQSMTSAISFSPMLHKGGHFEQELWIIVEANGSPKAFRFYERAAFISYAFSYENAWNILNYIPYQALWHSSGRLYFVDNHLVSAWKAKEGVLVVSEFNNIVQMGIKSLVFNMKLTVGRQCDLFQSQIVGLLRTGEEA